VSTDKYQLLATTRCLHLWDQTVQVILTCACFTQNIKDIRSFETSVYILHWALCISSQQFILPQHLWENVKFRRYKILVDIELSSLNRRAVWDWVRSWERCYEDWRQIELDTYVWGNF